MAAMAQDLRSMRSEIGTLKLEVEALQRENARLQQAVRAARESSENSGDILSVVDVKLAALRRELMAEADANRRKILKELSDKITALAAETEKSMKKLANAINAQPTAAVVPPTFNDDYPKTGIPYEVKPGDTLSGLADQFNSRVGWIRNANKIVDPRRDLRVGQRIFIPQAD